MGSIVGGSMSSRLVQLLGYFLVHLVTLDLSGYMNLFHALFTSHWDNKHEGEVVRTSKLPMSTPPPLSPPCLLTSAANFPWVPRPLYLLPAGTLFPFPYPGANPPTQLM